MADERRVVIFVLGGKESDYDANISVWEVSSLVSDGVSEMLAVASCSLVLLSLCLSKHLRVRYECAGWVCHFWLK